MDSHGDQRGHLDATGDREVVFCHDCSHEWYRDQHGLQCPNCRCEATEIIDPEHDPRELSHHSSASTSPERPPFRPPYADDPYSDNVSDPDEDDIEEHMARNHGFVFNRSIRNGPDRDHHNPNLDPTIHRFIDMVHSFGQGNEGTTGPQMNFPGGHMHFIEQRHQGGPHQPHIHRATFRSGPFGSGSTSFTIYSGPLPRHAAHSPTTGEGRGDPFQEMFASVMRDMPPPAHTQTGGGSPAFLRGLQDILGLLNPANAMAGDAVYSQEALDRIITNLMEVNPQSNAAPPATEEALSKLDRKAVNQSMLDGESKVECPICIDDMKEGDQVIFLPCKHWFHEDCVVLWLKEHNTCPICRSPIEKNEPGDGANRDAGQSGGPGSSDSPHDAHFPLFPGFGPNVSSRMNNDPSSQARQGVAGASTGGDPFNGSLRHEEFMDAQTRPHPLFGIGRTRPPVARPPSHGQSRLNEVLRSVSSLQERQRDREGVTPPSSYDTSRLQRRNSLSPTSPRMAVPGTPNSRIRERSPSQGSGRWAASDRETEREREREREREPQRSSASSGPFSWIRNRFSSGGDSGNGSSRSARH